MTTMRPLYSVQRDSSDTPDHVEADSHEEAAITWSQEDHAGERSDGVYNEVVLVRRCSPNTERYAVEVTVERRVLTTAVVGKRVAV